MKQFKFYKKWKDENKTTKGILIIIYMIVCIIALDYYQGYNHWKWEF